MLPKNVRGGMLALLAAVVLSLAGCAEQITIQVVDQQGYQDVLKRHVGKVVLVDFWATWCLPCVEKFHHTVELHKKYGDQALAVVSMSIDEPEMESQVLAFLEKHGAAFDNLLSKFGSGEQTFEAYDIEGGAVPYFKLYDRKGELRHTFFSDPAAAKPFTHADIEQRIQELLAEG